MFKPFGFTAKENSIFNIILVVSGIIGSFISSRYLDRENPPFKLIFNLGSGLGLIFVSLILVTLPCGLNKAIFGANLFLYGLFMTPTFSIIFPYIVELTYPSNEAVSNGIMLFSCRIFATTFVSETISLNSIGHHRNFVSVTWILPVCNFYCCDDTYRRNPSSND